MADPGESGRVSTSIYFRDPNLLKRIEELADKLGMSTSMITERILKSVLPEAEKKALRTRTFRMEGEITI